MQELTVFEQGGKLLTDSREVALVVDSCLLYTSRCV